MADISVIIDVLGAEDMEKAARVTQTLQNKVQSLGKQLQKGNITNREYQRGVQQLIKKNAQHAGGYQVLQKEVQRYAFSLQRQINETQKVADHTQRATNAVQQNTAAVKGNTGALATQSMAAQKSSKGMKHFASVGLQQVGYQFSDFAVQVQGGTSALVAFGQQGSQLAGLLFLLPGLLGAISGAVVSIAIPLATAFLNAKGATKTFKDSLDDLSESIDTYKSFAETASLTTEGLVKRFGQVSGQAQKLSNYLAEWARIDALEAVDEAVNKLAEDFGGLGGEMIKVTDQTRALAESILGVGVDEFSNELLRTVSDLSKQFDIASPKANDLVEAMRAFSEAEGVRAQVQAAVNLNDQFISIFGSISDIPPELREVARQAGLIALEAAEIEGEFSNVNDTVNNVTRSVDTMLASINAATRSTGQLSTEWVGVFRNAFAAAQAMAMGEGDILLGGVQKTNYRGGRGTVNPTFEGTQRENPLAQLAYNFRGDLLGLPTPGGGTSGGGGGAVQAAQEVEELNKQLSKSEQLMQDVGKTISQSFGDALMSIVDGSKSAADAFKDMARQILKQAFDMLVIKPIMDSIMGFFGGSQISGPSFGMGSRANFAPPPRPFADGGVVNGPTVFPMANGTGLMGEAGPEAIMPLKRGKNGKLGVQVEGGQQPIVINQAFNFSANGDDSVKRIIQQEAPKIASYTQQQILDQRRRGGAMKQTFG